jgi:DNA-binding MarR family transcriptional regulator
MEVDTAAAAAGRSGLSSEELEIIAGRLQNALYLLWARHGRSTTAEIGDRNLAGTQLAILTELCAASAVRITDLACSLRVRVPTASIAVQRLLRSGLVERSSDLVDQRVVRVGITDRGRCVLEGVRDARARRIRSSLAALSPRERELLGQALPVLSRLATVDDPPR